MSDNKPLLVEASLDIEGIKHARTLADDVAIDASVLSIEFTEQAEKFAWWATMCELGRDNVSRLSLELKRKDAEIDPAFRAEFNTEEQEAKIAEPKYTVKRLTEKMVENHVLHHPVHIEIENVLMDARKQLGLLQAGRDAMIQRKDMLISLGATFRAEGNSNPTILTDAARTKAREAAQRRKAIEAREVVKEKQPVGKKPIGKKPIGK